MGNITLRNGFVVTPRDVIRADLLVKDNHISRIEKGLQEGEIVDCNGCYILPGFRDQHIHDLKGFMEHQDNPERIGNVSKALASQGVTAYMIATVSAPLESLVSYLKTISKYLNSEKNGVDGARLEGANIEGTFILRECAGAQPLEYIVPPNSSEAKKKLDSLVETGVVRLINIIPDFGADLIKYASSKDLIVGCGHCKATASQLEEAYKAGLKYIVHLTNGDMGHSFKPFFGGGTYEGALVLPLFVELIIDGYHVDLRYVSDVIWRRVQLGRCHEVIAVTDGIFPVREEVPKVGFRLFSTLCTPSEDGGVFVVKGRVDKDGSILPVPPNTLCSSNLTMDRAFQNMLNMFTVDFQGFMIDRKALPLEDALRYASLFTSSNQALLQRVLNETGSIDIGKLADLTILRIEGGPGRYKVKIEKTMVAGRLFSF